MGFFPLFFVVIAGGAVSSQAYGAGTINFYGSVAEALSLDGRYEPVLASLLASVALWWVAFGFERSVLRDLKKDRPVPEGRFSLRAFVEMIMDLVYSLTKEQCGAGYRNYLPLMASIFFFVLFNNLSGLVPGLPPATEHFSMNLSLGLLVFLCYNYAGLKEHGVGYFKQFLGPVLAMAPLFIFLEVISHGVRPASLAFRLTANIFGDHMLLGVFAGMVPLVVPAALMVFGLLVACIQTFVFTMLTSIYISMAISHDH